MTVPAGLSCILPVNIDGIRYATAQLIARRDGKIYLQQLPGIPTEIAVDGKVLRRLKPMGVDRPVYKNIYLLTDYDAGRLFLDTEEEPSPELRLSYRKTREAGEPRTISIGVAGVAEEPTDADFEQAAVYELTLPEDRSGLLHIEYTGDCARLYADGKLIDDNFYNGRPFQYALWRLPSGIQTLELRILPLQNSMPVLFPREADWQRTGEDVKAVLVREKD